MFNFILSFFRRRNHYKHYWLLKECQNIVERGTGIRSFIYNGKARNVIIGPNSCLHKVSWGKEVIPRSVIEHKGKMYLVAQDNNDNDQIKAFDMNKIEEFYFRSIEWDGP